MMYSIIAVALIFILNITDGLAHPLYSVRRKNLNEIDENNTKKYTIAMKNIHMYNYLLAIKDETHI